MNFKERKKEDIKCPKCGRDLIFLQGDQWDYDREYCSDFRECDYEYEYDTSTCEEDK